MSKTLEVNAEDLEYGLEIVREISRFQPYSSISFELSDRIISAIEQTIQLTDWGMAKNKHKMKETAAEILDTIVDGSPGEPVNLNLTKYERKSIRAVVKLVKRVLENKKDGVVLV